MDLSAESSRIKLLWVPPHGAQDNMRSKVFLQGFPMYFLYLRIARREGSRVCSERGEARGWEKRELLASLLLKAVKKGKGPYFTHR